MRKRILDAYVFAQNGDMSKAHYLYPTVRFMPVEFWQEVDKCGEDVYEFFWNLYYPDNPIA